MMEPTYRLGASIWGFYGRRRPEEWPTLPDAVCAVLGVDSSLGVEVWASKALDAPPVADREIDELVGACEDAAFVSVHTRGAYWSWNPTAFRDEIDFAERVGARLLVLHPITLGLVDSSDRIDVPEILRIAEYGGVRGVRLAVENVCDSVWMLDRVLEEVGDDPESTNLGICVDVGHAHMSRDAGRDPVSNYLERYAGQLVHLHLHDNHGQSDEHLVPGEGTIDWPRALRTVVEIGFSGTVVLEVHPTLGNSASEAIEQGLRRLRSER